MAFVAKLSMESFVRTYLVLGIPMERAPNPTDCDGLTPKGLALKNRILEIGLIGRVPVERPDVVSIGPGTKLLAVEALARELCISGVRTLDFIKSLGIDVIEVSDRPYVNVVYLELALWWISRPKWLRKKFLRLAEPDVAVMEAFLKELKLVGSCYTSLKREAILARIHSIRKKSKQDEPSLKDLD